MPVTTCAVPEPLANASHPPMRDCVSILTETIDHANDLAEVIEDKLFGVGINEKCEKTLTPQNVQNGLDRSEGALKRLISRLELINARL